MYGDLKVIERAFVLGDNEIQQKRDYICLFDNLLI
jgi:hypothetical protein